MVAEKKSVRIGALVGLVFVLITDMIAFFGTASPWMLLISWVVSIALFIEIGVVIANAIADKEQSILAELVLAILTFYIAACNYYAYFYGMPPWRLLILISGMVALLVFVTLTISMMASLGKQIAEENQTAEGGD